MRVKQSILERTKHGMAHAAWNSPSSSELLTEFHLAFILKKNIILIHTETPGVIKGTSIVHVWMQEEIGKKEETASFVENILNNFVKFLEWNHSYLFRIRIIRSV